MTLAASGLAQAQSYDSPPEAIEFYRQAREDYAAGRYREASESLERALVLDPDSPTLVYNLARVYELLGELERALSFYERYRQLLPQQQAREAERAEATIVRLRGAQANAAAEEPVPVEAPREVEPLRQLPGLVLVRESGVADGLFWTALGSGGLLVSVGAVLGSIALINRSEADDFVLGRDGDGNQRDRLYSDATTFGVVADIGLGLGGLGIVGAVLLYFMRDHTVERAPVRAVDSDEDDAESGESAAWRVEPTFSPGLGGATAGVRGVF